jgi:DNA-binding HxlR family transcriptional regulator
MMAYTSRAGGTYNYSNFCTHLLVSSLGNQITSIHFTKYSYLLYFVKSFLYNEIMKKQSDTSCLQNTVDILGDKWTALILFSLTSGPRTFSDLEVGLAGISPRTLSQRLSRLAEEKILSKELYNERPPRYQYSLTEKGAELNKILKAMENWGATYSCQASATTPLSTQHA